MLEKWRTNKWEDWDLEWLGRDVVKACDWAWWFSSHGDENKAKTMKHTRLKLISDLYSYLYRSLSNRHKSFSFSAPCSSSCIQTTNGRHKQWETLHRKTNRWELRLSQLRWRQNRKSVWVQHSKDSIVFAAEACGELSAGCRWRLKNCPAQQSIQST